MKVFLKIMSLLSVSLFALTSCSDMNDGYSLNKIWIGYATVSLYGETYSGQPNFDLILDDGTLMKIAANNVYFPEGTELKDKARVVANFTILDDNTSGERDIYYIRLNAMLEVLLKNPVYSSEEDGDEVGNDPIDVKSIWFGGPYLNFTFEVGINDARIKHFINLWVDEEHPDADEDNIYVELRHNAYEDKPVVKAFGRVSFNILEFLPEGKESVNVHVRYTNYDGEVIEDSGEFSRDGKHSGKETSSEEKQSSVNIY